MPFDDDLISEALEFSGASSELIKPKRKATSGLDNSSLLNHIYNAADEIGVPREIARRQLWQESKFKSNALSPKGAHGVAQFMPGTAKRYKVNTSDPVDSVRGWKEYMRDLLKRFDGDLELALAGYNAGEGAVEKYGRKVPPYKETQDYVAKIMGGQETSARFPRQNQSNMADEAMKQAMGSTKRKVSQVPATDDNPIRNPRKRAAQQAPQLFDPTIPNITELLRPPQRPMTFQEDVQARAARKATAKQYGISLESLRKQVTAEMQRPETYSDQYGTRQRMSRPDPYKVEEEVLRRANEQIAEIERKKRVAQISITKKVAQVPLSVGQGAASGLGGIVKGTGVASKAIADRLFDTEGLEAKDTWVYQFGDYIQKEIPKMMGSNPDLEQEFFIGKSPSVIGQTIPFMLGGWVSNSPKLAVSLIGGTVTAADAYDEVKSLGGNEDDAMFAGILAGGLLGPTELIGLRGAMHSLEGTVMEATLRAALRRGWQEGRKDIIENAVQEAFQETAQGYITGRRRSLKEIGEAALLGGIGGTASIPTATISSYVHGKSGGGSPLEPTSSNQRPSPSGALLTRRQQHLAKAAEIRSKREALAAFKEPGEPKLKLGNRAEGIPSEERARDSGLEELSSRYYVPEGTTLMEQAIAYSKERRGETSDQENAKGLPSKVGEGQEPVQTEPLETRSGEATGSSGILQTQEGEIVPPSRKSQFGLTKEGEIELGKRALEGTNEYEIEKQVKESEEEPEQPSIVPPEQKPAFHGSPHEFEAEVEYTRRLPDGTEEHGFMPKVEWDSLQQGKGRKPRVHKSSFSHVDGAVFDDPREYTFVKEHPHGRFSLQKIGTGEGAQAYGWGLYFSGSKEVARYYRDTLSKMHGEKVGLLPKRGSPIMDWSHMPTKELKQGMQYAEWIVADEDNDFSTIKELRAHLKDQLRQSLAVDLAEQVYNVKGLFSGSLPITDSGVMKAALKFLDKYGDQFEIAKPKKGRLYEVELAPADDEWLDWDEPLAFQSEKVKAALKNLDVMDVTGDMLGSEAYGQVQDTARRSSEALRVEGVRGIRYATGATRRKSGAKEYNYVLFDDRDVEIKGREKSNQLKGRYTPTDLDDIPTELPITAIESLESYAPPDRIPKVPGTLYKGHLAELSPSYYLTITTRNDPYASEYIAATTDPEIPGTKGRLMEGDYQFTRTELEEIAKAPEVVELTKTLEEIHDGIISDLKEVDPSFASSKMAGLSFASSVYLAQNLHGSGFSDGKNRIFIGAHDMLGAIHALHMMGEIEGTEYSKAWSRMLVESMYHEILHNKFTGGGKGEGLEGHSLEFDEVYFTTLYANAPRVIEYANRVQEVLEADDEKVTNIFGQQALDAGIIGRFTATAIGGAAEHYIQQRATATGFVSSGLGEQVGTGRGENAGELSEGGRAGIAESRYPLYQRYDFADPETRKRFAEKLEQFMGPNSIFKNNLEGGYREVYHSTDADFSAFEQRGRWPDIGFHFGTQEAANERLISAQKVRVRGAGYERMAGKKELQAGRPHNIGEEFEPVDEKSQIQILPVFLKLENPVRIGDVSNFSGLKLLEELERLDYITPEEAQDIRRITSANDKTIAIRKLLEAKGYDGIQYENGVEDKGSDSYIVFHPEQIKSAIGNSGDFLSDSPNILRASDPVSLAIQSAIETGKLLYQAGKSFVQWSKDMVAKYGPGIKLHLTNIWEQVHRALETFAKDETGTFDPLGASQFIKDDIAPAIKGAVVGMVQAKDTIQKIFAPSARGADARTMAGVLREGGARLWLKYFQAEHALNGFRDAMRKLPKDVQWQAMADTENGKKVAQPELQPAFDIMRRLNDENLALIQKHGRLSTFIDNYMGHLFKDPAQASQVLQQLYGKRPLAGKKGMLKQRAFRADIVQAMKDAKAAGLDLVPAADNPIDMFMLKYHEARKFIMAMDAMAELKALKMAKFVKPSDAHDMFQKGYREINDSVATVFGGPSAKPQGGTLIRGKYMVPEAAAQVINNHLSPGLRQNAAFRGFMAAANTLNQFQLGWSLFHAGFTTIDAMSSKLALAIMYMSEGKVAKAAENFIRANPITAPMENLVRGHRLMKEAMSPGSVGGEYSAVIPALIAGGFRPKMEKVYTNDMVNKFKNKLAEGNYLGAAWRAPLAATELASKPVLEWLVPRQKLGVAMDLVRFEIDKNPHLSLPQIRYRVGRIVDSVDNRLGQMTYDNIFWDRSAKDIMMFMFRSVGWNLGTKREIGGGIVDAAKLPFQISNYAVSRLKGKPSTRPELSIRTAYVMSFIAYSALLGAITQYLYTGEPPKEGKDYFFPRTGNFDERGLPERVNLPTYMKDLYHYRDIYKIGPHTRKTFMSKLHPILGMIGDLLQNEDYWGVEIANPDDPFLTRTADRAKYIGKAALPFGFQNFMKERERGSGLGKSLIPIFTGITPAPSDVNQTEAEEELYLYNQEHRPQGSRTKEEAGRSKRKYEIRAALLKGDTEKASKLTTEGLSNGLLAPKDLGEIMDELTTSPLQKRFSMVSDLADALRIWHLMKPSEKLEVEELMKKKTARLLELPPAQQEKLVPRYVEAMKFYTTH